MPVLLHKIWQVLGVLKKHLGELERKYARFQSRTASNFKLRISLLLLFSFVNVIVGAVVYQWVTSEGWGDAMFTVYAVRQCTLLLLLLHLLVVLLSTLLTEHARLLMYAGRQRVLLCKSSSSAPLPVRPAHYLTSYC
jgi:uncharacterized Tic20 family protein